MAAPRIKRYALVPDNRPGSLRSFQLARVASNSPSSARLDRLARMEEVADREREPAGPDLPPPLSPG